MSKKLNESLVNHAMNYVNDNIKENEKQNVLDTLDETLAIINRKIDATKELINKNKVSFGKSFSNIKSYLEIDTTINNYTTISSYNEQLKALKVIKTITLKAIDRANTVPEKTNETVLADSIKRLISKDTK